MKDTACHDLLRKRGERGRTLVEADPSHSPNASEGEHTPSERLWFSAQSHKNMSRTNKTKRRFFFFNVTNTNSPQKSLLTIYTKKKNTVKKTKNSKLR